MVWQGWRLEVRRFPELLKYARRVGHDGCIEGGYYTQDVSWQGARSKPLKRCKATMRRKSNLKR